MDNIFFNTARKNKKRFFSVSLLISIIFFLYLFDNSSNGKLSKNEDLINLKNIPKKRMLQSENITNLTNTSNSTNKTLSSNETNINDEEVKYIEVINGTQYMNFSIVVKSLYSNVTEKVIYYNFIKDLKKGFYFGDWENLNIKKNIFKEKKGKFFMRFYQRRELNYIVNLGLPTNNSNLSVYFSLRDGDYLDNYLEGNFTFNFDKVEIINNLQKDNFSIIIPNTSVSYAYGEYIDIDPKTTFNNSFINITFYKLYRQFESRMEYQISSTEYGKVTIEIKNASSFLLSNNDTNASSQYQKNFEVSLIGKAYGSYRYSEDTLNYSIFMSLFALIEIYYTAEFFKVINDNDQMALNTDIFTVFLQIMWCSLLCGAHFYYAITKATYSFEYLAISTAYFFLFAVFLLRILFVGWKSRNNDIADIRIFRKKLLRFYLFFYFCLFFTMISIKLWYSYFILTFFHFGGMWIGQIIYSAKRGTKPPMPYLYILAASSFKIAISIYNKGYEDNIFGYRPNYLKVFIVSFAVIAEAVILCLQKLIGPKFIIPKKFRKKAFDYYKHVYEVTQSEKEKECVICLDKIENIFVENLESYEDNKKDIKIWDISEKLIRFSEKLKEMRKKNMPYMVTPCNHIFHTKCLEPWLEVKNVCPCCRQNIPPLEN